MRTILAAIIAAAALAAGGHAASASVLITVDKTSQRLSVDVDGSRQYSWPVSTARWGYSTPNGTYRPQWLARKWYSRKYHMSPMPYSIFFHGGYAIHGSYEISRLGSPASHGCIRLHPENAAVLFSIVQKHGKADTRIVITGTKPAYIARSTTKRTPRERADYRTRNAERDTTDYPVFPLFQFLTR